MAHSGSFDRAAGYYDRTRLLPEYVAKPGLEAIMVITGPEARVLDVGTGTGRISIPLLERGLDLIGCDLSPRMLLRLREKFPGARLTQADASELPFPKQSFDVLITAHVLHLIHTWREALREFQRVLAPGGIFLNLRTWEPVGFSMRQQLRAHWRDWLAEHGINAYLKGVKGSAELYPELQSLGAQVTEVDVIHYPITYTLGEELGRIEARVGSDTWEIPDETFSASLVDLCLWTTNELGSLDEPRQDELQFAMDVARF
jgi:ubiquinone/menaquinone biosynthesis C-methylase UbiE